MWNTYIKIEDKPYLFGQDARTKEWYCKDLPAATMKEADKLMNEANRICNKNNKKEKKVAPKKENVTTMVKGLE